MKLLKIFGRHLDRNKNKSQFTHATWRQKFSKIENPQWLRKIPASLAKELQEKPSKNFPRPFSACTKSLPISPSHPLHLSHIFFHSPTKTRFGFCPPFAFFNYKLSKEIKENGKNGENSEPRCYIDYSS